jgi:putative transposase
MPRYLRWKINEATYFFTVVTQRQRPLFAERQNRRWLRASFQMAHRALPFEIDAIVLLPDHLHVLMRPLEGVDYSKVWRKIKSTFTNHVLRRQQTGASKDDAPYLGGKGASNGDAPYGFGRGRRKGEADVWQRRFYEHTVRDENDWGRHVDYIHWNPVKHGLVRRPQDWRWSSIHRYITKGLLVPDWPSGKDFDFPQVQE